MIQHDQVRFGVVGIGNIGSAHAACLARGAIEGGLLAALCDCDPAKAQLVRQQYPAVPFFDEAQALFASGLCDAVIISVPHRFHVPLGIAALAQGLHVLVEKPAGVSVSEVRRLNEAARQSGRVFGIMFNQRTDPLFQKAKALLSAGALGAMKRVNWIITNWYRTQAYYNSGGWRASWTGEGGGVLLNQAPHNLDLLQWICGMPKRVRAFCYEGKYHQIEVEDEATLYLEYENGATGLFVTSTGEYPGTNRLEITGERGKMVLEEGKLKLFTTEESEREFCFSLPVNAPLPALQHQTIEFSDSINGHAAIIQNFADAVRTGAPLLSPGEEGINELSLSNAAYLSSWQQDWVDLPLDAALFDEQLNRRAAKNSGGTPADREAGASVGENDVSSAAGSIFADSEGSTAPAAGGQGSYKDKWKVNW